MNNIFQALNSGYPPEEILSFISKVMPQFANPIRKATQAGYNAKNILGFLSKSIRNDIKPGMSESEIHAANRRHDAQLTKTGLKVAATAVAAPLAARVFGSALQRALPTTLRGQAAGGVQQFPGVSQQFPGAAPGAMNQVSSALGPTQQPPQAGNIQPPLPSQPPIPGAPLQPEAATIPQPPQIPQVPTSQRDINKNVQLIKNVKEDTRIANLLSGGMQPKDIAALIKKVAPKDVAKALEKASGGIQGAIEDFAQTLQQPAAQTPEELIQPAEAIEAAPSIPIPEEELPIEPKRIEKTNIVSSPQGVGEVREIRNNKAIIEVDGKKHQVSVDELEQEPPDIADLYDKLFEAIPDEYKSRMMNFAGYDEEANELLFRPHGGAAYVYKEIPPEFAEELKNRLHRAKTTGKNMYGMWTEGDQSYGAGMSALIKKLQAQYGGKGKEYVRKYLTLFDILGIPHEEKKRREEEERRKRKRNG